MERTETKLRRVINKVLGANLLISLIIFVLTFLICSICVPKMLQMYNILNVLRNNSISGIMAVGMTIVMLAGEIDLSVGAIMNLSMSVGALAVTAGRPTLGFLLTLLIGLLLGTLNGVVIAKTRVASLMITLGMASVYNGLANIVANGQAVYLYEAPVYLYLGKESTAGIPNPVIVFLIIILIFIFITKCTKFGRELYFTGANVRAAYLSGINTDVIKVAAFALCGLLAAFSGPMLAATVNRTIPTIGNGYEVTAIAIAVLGGTSLDGGKGSIIGTLLGVLTLGFLCNALSLSGMGTYAETVMKGILIVVIVVVFSYAGRKAK